MRRLLPGLLALVALAAPAATHAQDLARIDTLLAGGRFTEARTTLERWRAAHPPNSRDVSADQQARALLLEGRIATDPQKAIDAYLALVLGYPTAAEAPRALLLLGQGLLTTGQADRARGYLERRVRDYPGAEDRAAALLWLARAQLQTARTADACGTLRDAIALRAADADMRALLAHEQDQACSESAANARPVATPAAPPAAPPAQTADTRGAERLPSAQPTQAERTAPARVARYTVQAGAFSTAERAERLARTLGERGFDDARVVYVPANSLARVRIGFFANTADAAALATRLRVAGFDAAVATDAHTERARR